MCLYGQCKILPNLHWVILKESFSIKILDNKHVISHGDLSEYTKHKFNRMVIITFWMWLRGHFKIIAQVFQKRPMDTVRNFSGHSLIVSLVIRVIYAWYEIVWNFSVCLWLTMYGQSEIYYSLYCQTYRKWLSMLSELRTFARL